MICNHDRGTAPSPGEHALAWDLSSGSDSSGRDGIKPFDLWEACEVRVSAYHRQAVFNSDRRHHGISNEASSQVVLLQQIAKNLPMASIGRWYPGRRRVEPIDDVLQRLLRSQRPG